MFVPVPVEILPGSICIGILPVRLEKKAKVKNLPSNTPTLPGGNIAFADMFRSECVATKDVNNEKKCQMDFTSINAGKVWVDEFRITDFTFGGVMIANPKFDPFRIDQEDQAWLKANVKNKKNP